VVFGLAWHVTNEMFLDFLDYQGIKYKSAYVVFKKDGGSRGYGFIDCINNDEQKRALKVLDRLYLEDRYLSVKIAMKQDK